MISSLQNLFSSIPIASATLALIGLGVGVFVIVYGVVGATAGPSPNVRRMNAGYTRQAHGADFDLINGNGEIGGKLLKAFAPSSKQERSEVSFRMRQAGILGKRAVKKYYLVRALLGLVLPTLFIFTMALPTYSPVFQVVDAYVPKFSLLASFQIVTALMVAGYYGPWLYLKLRIASRRKRIWLSFPNALDLLQVAVEAGLGFDAAMVRVSNELAKVAPDISQEFMALQLEIQAGKERDIAFLDMSARTGLDEMKAFSNVILQSSNYGTSVSKALNTFASDLRLDRELKAQQKANRLPVQMSAVMALFMMPVLLMICLTPMLIRWIRMFE